jgi:DNA-3-methyladenine glycosylase I
LTWLTVLKKREGYRAAFDSFEPRAIARYDASKVKALLADEGIIRNRLKISAATTNAKAFLRVQKEFGTFDRYIWQFIGGKTKRNSWTSQAKIPALTSESSAMSDDLTRRGFRFVGPTICYAFMQATGMVNDHTTDCFRYRQVQHPRR